MPKLSCPRVVIDVHRPDMYLFAWPTSCGLSDSMRYTFSNKQAKQKFTVELIPDDGERTRIKGLVIEMC